MATSRNQELTPDAAEAALLARIDALQARRIDRYALSWLAFGPAEDQAALARALDAAERYGAELDAISARLSATETPR